MKQIKVKRESLTKQISDKLEELILTGELKVGEKIPPEPELMELFQVSRNTIREAIQSLTWAGLLTVKQGDGTYVSSSSCLQANLEKEYDRESIQDIKEARNCIEVTIAHLAAKRRDDDDVIQIHKMLRKRRELAGDSKENTQADIDFHIAVAHASHNKILIDMYEFISEYIKRQIEEQGKDDDIDSDRIDELHEILYEAIRDQKPHDAAHAVLAILNF